jgi:hypothetical protein
MLYLRENSAILAPEQRYSRRFNLNDLQASLSDFKIAPGFNRKHFAYSDQP